MLNTPSRKVIFCLFMPSLIIDFLLIPLIFHALLCIFFVSGVDFWPLFARSLRSLFFRSWKGSADMLTYVKTFKDYKDFLISQKRNLSYNAIRHHYESKKIRSLLWKLGKLDTDPIRDYLLSLYSQIYGRPAIDPLIFIRSFICMLRLKVWSIDEWCRKLKNDPALQYLIGT